MKMNFNFISNEMKKPMKIMLISVGILFGLIFLYKIVMHFFLEYIFFKNKNPVMTVSTAVVKYADWQPQLESVGSLRATVGVNVTAQLGGMIQTIYFTPGAFVTQGTALVQQNADTNIAQLHALEANEKLAQITYDRDRLQYQVQAVSKQQLDTDEQNLKSLQSQVLAQKATIAKLTIRAPFTGYLGISNVNPGQYLNPGDTIVTLQSLDPIYVDFYLPQQALAQLKLNQKVILMTDTYPKESFTGKITTINPAVDVSTRNVEVEATLPNPHFKLLPGMFADVKVNTSETKSYLTVPQAAITFNPYGNIVFLVKNTGKGKKHHEQLAVEQVFVETGEMRGEQIAVLSGIKAGDEIVTSGQLKLKNGSFVTVNNSVQPHNNIDPSVPNEHGG